MNVYPKLDQVSYQKLFKGFFLIDCVIRKKDLIYFLLEQEYDEETKTPPKAKILTRLIEYDVFDPKTGPWGFQDLKGMQRLKAGVSYQPKEQFVGVSLNDHVYVLGSGDDELEKDIPNWYQNNGVGLRGGTRILKVIDGFLYAVGGNRSVVRREGRQTWTFVGDLPDGQNEKGVGFGDIDGFSAQDIYAAGGYGDVWHFDGSTWRRVSFPSNMDLYNVCCAGDGYVYIGAESGSVFKGRGNEWKLISRGDLSLPFRDMVWYQDKIWATSDCGVWVVEKGKVKEADIPEYARGCAGHLSASDGVMLLAGIYGAALHNGKDWQMIIDFDDLG